jgi:hypothetical protein
MKEEYLTVSPPRADENMGAPLPVPPVLALDLNKYRAEIEDFQITDEQAEELLRTLWSIMSAFVELGFSVNICERILENVAALADGTLDSVKSLASTSTTESAPDDAEKEDS